MSTRRNTILAVGVVALLVGAVVGWFLYTYKQVEAEVTLSPIGEARFNPLYALRTALRAQGQPAASQRWLRMDQALPGPRDTLVLYGDAAPFTEAEARRLFDWVKGGGRLVLRGEAVAGSTALAGLLGLQVVPGDVGCVDIVASTVAPGRESAARRAGIATGADADDEAAQAEAARQRPVFLCGPSIRKTGGDAQLSGADGKGGHRHARVPVGAGEVVVLPSLHFLSNHSLRSRAAVELAHQVLAPGFGRGGFLLVYGSDMPSLLRLILQYGWPVLVPALLALFAWLALRGQRFGSLQPRPAGDRRALLEHVQAAGEFAFRRGRGRTLYTALRERFERRLAQRDPARFALQGDARVLALAERFGLPAARVRQALDPRDLQRPDVFLQSMSTLAQMRLRL